ncbi:MAG TPA: RHS repeat-associated core domain-containing protein [Acidobacteriota bacterium]|nr:RHS repeat-associated core domain-containing protein [Acidobacteriota bacterium]
MHNAWPDPFFRLNDCPSTPGEILLKSNIVGPEYDANGELVGINVQLVWSGDTGSFVKIFRSFEGCNGEFEERDSVPVSQSCYYDTLQSGQIAYYYVEGRRNNCENPIGKSDCYAIDVSPMTGLNEGTVYFYVRDHLGSSRLVLDVEGNIQSRFNYEPYGVELTPLGSNTTNEKYKFTGQERDYDTGMDYMHFRYYGSNIGRFMKPDNMITNAMNPQSWNLYSYVNNSPINFNDPSGHDLRGKQGKLGMHQALMGVPNVDISGMLTPVEFYEYFGGFAQIGSGITSAGEYYRGAYSSAQEAKARGFNFYSPYGYTASGSLNQSVLMGNNATSASPCGADSICMEEREAYVSIVVWQLRGLFQFYYPNIYSSFLNFDIRYEDVNNGGWIQSDFTEPRVGIRAFDLSIPSAWRVENGKIMYRGFSDVFIKLSLTILHEFAHYYLRQRLEEPVVAQAYVWYMRFFGEKW